MPDTPDRSWRSEILPLALPIILQNLVQYVQMLVNTVLLGHANPVYLSAMGNVLTPFFTMISFLFAITSGVTIMVAHAYGARQYRHAARYAEVSMFWTTALSLFFFAVWFFFPEPILHALGARGDVLAYGVEFIRIVSFSLVFLGAELTIAATLQGVGLTRPIMYVGFGRNLVNAALDLVLIFGYLGFPAMGVAGAAIATIIANFGAQIALFFVLRYHREIPLRITFSGMLRPAWRVFRRVARIGIPAGLEFMLFNLGQLFIVAMLNTIDAMAVGIFSLVNRLQMVGLFIYLGFARAAMTLVGQRLGAGDPHGAMHVALAANRYSLAVCVGFSVAFLAVPSLVLSLFTDDRGLIERAVPLLAIAAFTVFPQTVNVVIGHAIRGMKDTRWMLVTQSFGTAFAVGAAAFAIFGLHAGLVGMFVTYFLDESLRAGVNWLRFRRGRAFFAPLAFWRKRGPSAP